MKYYLKLLAISMVLVGGYYYYYFYRPFTEPAHQPEAPTPVVIQQLPDLQGRLIRVGGDNMYVPFNYVVKSTGKTGGWDYAFFEAACQHLNCKTEFIPITSSELITTAAQGKIDIAANGISIRSEWSKKVTFSQPYMQVQQRLLVRLNETRFKDYRQLQAMPQLKLAVYTSQYPLALKLVGAARLVSFNDFNTMIDTVVTGQADATIMDEYGGQGYKDYRNSEVKLIGPPVETDYFGLIFPLNSDLVEPFNLVLDKLRQEGRLTELDEEFFSHRFTLTYNDIVETH